MDLKEIGEDKDDSWKEICMGPYNEFNMVRYNSLEHVRYSSLEDVLH